MGKLGDGADVADVVAVPLHTEPVTIAATATGQPDRLDRAGRPSATLMAMVLMSIKITSSTARTSQQTADQKASGRPKQKVVTIR
jgi:hypothetical protein